MRPDLPDTLAAAQGGLIVSCQAWEGDAFHGPESMARFSRAAVDGGGRAIRANSPEDVRAIRAAVGVPVIAIQKRAMPDGRVLITPTLEDARALAEAGATAIALDCTARGQVYGALERLRRIREELRVPAAADIATLEEARAASAAGADFVLSTMRGYTRETEHAQRFDATFIRDLVSAVPVPVIAEGRVWTPEEAVAALDAGAFAVVVGTAITRPRDITARFATALAARARLKDAWYAGIDLGATNIKAGLVRDDGTLEATSVRETSAAKGRASVLAALEATVAFLMASASRRAIRVDAIGVATAGWIDAATGRVLFGTRNLPDWTGTDLSAAVASTGLPAAFENDANAAAIAE